MARITPRIETDAARGAFDDLSNGLPAQTLSAVRAIERLKDRPRNDPGRRQPRLKCDHRTSRRSTAARDPQLAARAPLIGLRSADDDHSAAGRDLDIRPIEGDQLAPAEGAG